MKGGTRVSPILVRIVPRARAQPTANLKAAFLPVHRALAHTEVQELSQLIYGANHLAHRWKQARQFDSSAQALCEASEHKLG